MHVAFQSSYRLIAWLGVKLLALVYDLDKWSYFYYASIGWQLFLNVLLIMMFIFCRLTIFTATVNYRTASHDSGCHKR